MAEAAESAERRVIMDIIYDCHYCNWACCDDADAESKVKCYVDDFEFFDHDVADPKEAESCPWFRFCDSFPKW